MIFSSDSEGDDFHITGKINAAAATVAMTTGNNAVKKKISDDWIFDEDDFCILPSPTTAKVVSLKFVWTILMYITIYRDQDQFLLLNVY